MATNYGIRFCKEGIKHLEEKENEMFDSVGHGFDRFSHDFLQLLKFKELLEQFQYEKNNGLEPSYNPEKHGSLRD